MKQKEMSTYLKLITLVVALFLFLFVVWFLPEVFEKSLVLANGKPVYVEVCIFMGITSIPCFLCLAHFWKICGKIGQDQSFTKENSDSLKKMSHWMIFDTALYILFFIWFCFTDWSSPLNGLFFAILLAVFVCVTLAVVCIALSHLVYKASLMQEEYDLTI